MMEMEFSLTTRRWKRPSTLRVFRWKMESVWNQRRLCTATQEEEEKGDAPNVKKPFFLIQAEAEKAESLSSFSEKPNQSRRRRFQNKTHKYHNLMERQEDTQQSSCLGCVHAHFLFFFHSLKCFFFFSFFFFFFFQLKSIQLFAFCGLLMTLEAS